MVAIYARQSIDKKDSISIESQIEHCKAKLAPNETYKIYCDRGFSGKNTDRPQFLAMKRDIESGEISKVIIYRLDRISRAILDFANMMELFDKHCVGILSCSDPIDTTTPMGRAMLSVTMTFAQLERETIQQRVRDNYYARGKSGFYLGGRAPFGYHKAPTTLNGKATCYFEPREGQAQLVAQLFFEYANTDISLGKLAVRLTEEGMMTNSGRAFSSVTLGRLLRNPVYVKADADVYCYLKGKGAAINSPVGEFMGEKGCYVYAPRGGISTSKFTDLSKSFVTLAPHKGLIPSHLWLRCQRKLDANKQIKNSGKGTHSWLSGLLKCGYCGMAMSVVNNNRGESFVTCGGRKLKLCFGRKRVIKIEEIEEGVGRLLLHRIGLIKTRPMAGEDSASKNKLKIQLVQLEEKIENLLGQMEQANEVVMGYINRDVEGLDIKKREILAKLQKLSGREQIKNEGTDLNDCMKNWAEFNLEERKKIAKVFIQKVSVTDEEIRVIFY